MDLVFHHGGGHDGGGDAQRLIPLAIACLALAVSPVARADGGATAGAKQPSTIAALLGHLKLRRGLDDKNLLARPADLAVTWPGTGPRPGRSTAPCRRRAAPCAPAPGYSSSSAGASSTTGTPSSPPPRTSSPPG